VGVPRRSKPTPPARPPEIDLNQVVAYNVRAARELRGWTQEEFADRLEPYLGTRLTQASVSGIERAWDGERRREFDAHELLIFAMVFGLPILWFLLPPPGDHRVMRATTRQVDELYVWLLGRPDQLDPVYARLRQHGIVDPNAADQAVEAITGTTSTARQWSYKERRKELLLALLDQHADGLDAAVDELGAWVDHLRQVGIRGFVAEHTNDADFTHITPAADQATAAGRADETAPAGSGAKAPRKRSTTSTKAAAPRRTATRKRQPKP
jgi:transcriptional regulator with XRE-family HTH domain